MKTLTSLVAADVRLNQWALEVKECQSRPEGMTVEAWCQQRGLKKVTYYNHLRKVRKACLSMVDVEEAPTFVEIQDPLAVKNTVDCHSKISAVLPLDNGKKIEIFEHATQTFLINLLEAYAHVK